MKGYLHLKAYRCIPEIAHRHLSLLGRLIDKHIGLFFCWKRHQIIGTGAHLRVHDVTWVYFHIISPRCRRLSAAVQAAVAPRGSEISVLMLEAYSCSGGGGRTGPTCSCGICRNNHCKLAE